MSDVSKVESGWKRSPVVFGLSMLLAGGLGAVGAITWLEGKIIERVENHLGKPSTRASFKGEQGPKGDDGGIPSVALVASAILKDEKGALLAEFATEAKAAATLAVSEQPAPEVVMKLPEGIVVASWKACATLGDGWSDFHHGQGRMIVGAGDPANNPFGNTLTKRTVWGPRMQNPPADTVGGKETVTLTEGQMRAHKHVMLGTGSGLNSAARAGETIAQRGSRPETGIRDVNQQYRLVGARGTPNVGATSVYGSSEAFSIMPPYIALYYCKKD